ncbi:MAG: flagellar biosynthesis protein [Actinobacteria bacterium]|nr:flagellar biosynthesis protein [Actinomycetota bacterium]
MSSVSGIGGAGSTGYTPAPRRAPRPAAPGAPTFGDELQRRKRADGGEGAGGVQFSKHAAERVQRRGIGGDPATVQRLEKGVELAAKKGSRAAVVLVDSTAYVVAPQTKTVITAVDQSQMKEQVFTNIDTAVLA